MLKKEARKLYGEKRKAMTLAERLKADDLLLIQLQLLGLPMLNNVLTYWPIEENNEPNTHLFTRYLEFKFPELQLLYPVADFANHQMKAVAVNEQTIFNRNEYNIFEPDDGPVIGVDEIDMVIVPLLVVDSKGCRVGYGKGFYDKFMAGCRQDCVKMGFSYFEPIGQIDDCHEFDVPLNFCITPYCNYVF